VQNPKADEAQFKAAAEAAGLVVERRDWMTTTAQNNDPEASKPSHEFLRFNGFLRNLPADEVSAVQQDRMRLRSYLVRSLGQREPPEVKLTPNDFSRIVQSLEQQSFEDFVTANFLPRSPGPALQPEGARLHQDPAARDS
jgi:HAMP domain-containing protein